MNSIEKVDQLILEIREPPGAEAGALELGLKTALQFGEAQLREMLPASAQDMDELLGFIATKVLEARSDGAPPDPVLEAALRAQLDLSATGA